MDFKNLKVPAMRGPEMMPSQRRQKSTHPSGFQHFNFLHDFLKNQWISKIWGYRPCGVPKWCRPGGGKHRHIHQDFNISTFYIFFWKIIEFRKSEGTGHAATRNDAVPEAAKIDTSIRISKFQLFACLLKNHWISQIWGYRPCGHPKWCRPGDGKNRHILQDFCFFSSHFLRPSTELHNFTPVASGPHIPRPKDCPGLGYPNTLKLYFQ